MFLLNVPKKGDMSRGVVDADCAVLLAQERMRHDMRPREGYRRVLFDPQLYLSGLDAAASESVCANLASYPWFGVPDVHQYESGNGLGRRAYKAELKEHTRENWPGGPPTGGNVPAACAEAIHLQLSLNCTSVVLPSPLLDDAESAASLVAEWLDAGLAAADQAWAPEDGILATVPLSEAILQDSAFETNGLLDILVDQVTAREEVGGIYVVVNQNVAQHPFQTPTNVLRAYARLSRRMSEAKLECIVNFADVFGVCCIGLGATGFASGPSAGLRRLSLAGYVGSGGLPHPYYYSHRAIADYRSEHDLRLLRRVGRLGAARDDTTYSSAWTHTLLNIGSTAPAPAAWAWQPNNVFDAAQPHFICRLHEVGEGLRGQTAADRLATVTDWLQSAAQTGTSIEERIPEDDEIMGCVAPANEWLEIVEMESE